jgi:hypothetical protein
MAVNLDFLDRFPDISNTKYNAGKNFRSGREISEGYSAKFPLLFRFSYQNGNQQDCGHPKFKFKSQSRDDSQWRAAAEIVCEDIRASQTCQQIMHVRRKQDVGGGCTGVVFLRIGTTSRLL